MKKLDVTINYSWLSWFPNEKLVEDVIVIKKAEYECRICNNTKHFTVGSTDWKEWLSIYVVNRMETVVV